MAIQTVERPMAKRDDEAAKVDREVLRICRIVASYRGISVAEYISETLRPTALKDLEAEQTKMSRSKARRERGE